MSKSGFIRKAIIIAALTWAWVHFFFSDGQYIQSPNLRRFGQIAIVIMSVWGIITLLAHRLGSDDG